MFYEFSVFHTEKKKKKKKRIKGQYDSCFEKLFWIIVLENIEIILVLSQIYFYYLNLVFSILIKEIRNSWCFFFFLFFLFFIVFKSCKQISPKFLFPYSPYFLGYKTIFKNF